MPSPRIGISCDVGMREADGEALLQLDFRYAEAIFAAGGDPVLLMPGVTNDAVLETLDGWLIPGGNDLSPSSYGEQPHPEVCVLHPRRESFEWQVLRKFQDSNLPILGICFGSQFLNVAHGGTLHTHLPDVIGHNEHRSGFEEIDLIESSRLFSLGLPIRFTGSTSHHQAVKDVAPGWKIAALAKDGVIEAVEEDSNRFRFGVQWHPERTPDSEATRALFAAFVEACRQWALIARSARMTAT
ncbi:MAG: putative glutamine amidotransferase [Fimbriimonadales bacterium]|nr:putative glutamine amidotransferase [Fimbriimonadales bacterium]